MPSSPLRRQLRAHGHALSPLVRIGKDGITAALLRQLTHILFDHELCKVKLESESPVDRFAAAESLAGAPGVNVVQILGRTILVYKRHPQHPRYEGERAKAKAAELRERAVSRSTPAEKPSKKSPPKPSQKSSRNSSRTSSKDD